MSSEAWHWLRAGWYQWLCWDTSAPGPCVQQTGTHCGPYKWRISGAFLTSYAGSREATSPWQDWGTWTLAIPWFLLMWSFRTSGVQQYIMEGAAYEPFHGFFSLRIQDWLRSAVFSWEDLLVGLTRPDWYSSVFHWRTFPFALAISEVLSIGESSLVDGLMLTSLWTVILGATGWDPYCGQLASNVWTGRPLPA